MPDWARQREDLARALGDDRKRLRNELNDAKSCLRRVYLKFFRQPHFDFEKQRLVGDDGYFLQWLIRPRPDKPESYKNQQTSAGSIFLYGPEEL